MSGFGGAVKLTGESEYRKALNQISMNLKELSSQMKVVSTSFSNNDKSIEALTSKQKVLNDTLTQQKSKLSTLQSQYASMETQYNNQTAKHAQLLDAYNAEKAKLGEIGRTLGTTSQEYQDQNKKVAELANAVTKSTQAQDANEKSMSKMRIEINNAQAVCNETERALHDLGKEAEDSGKEAEKAGDGFTVFKGIVANLATSAIQSAISGLKKLGSSLINIGKQAYSNYATYEQLVGGIETLFGESSDKLIKYANNAYATAGLSANEYMEQATSFSATLLQGLQGDTEQAVAYADLAIKDMSDNANKMGTDMQMIENAYQGFAKQNYTMLDNLKLGYGGTAGEMARLINDSGVLGDAIEVTAKTVKDVPFNQIIDAIHKTQQQIGITGTTALEASDTIEGSTKAVNASWQNLLTGIADGNADLSDLLKKFTNNLITMAKNSVPRIKQIVSGMFSGIKTMLREFAPEVADTILPIVEKISGIVKTLGSFIVNNFSTIAPIILGIATAFGVWNAAMAITGTITAATTAVSGLTAGVGLATKAQTVWNAVMSANPIGAVVTAVALLTTGLIALSEHFNKLPDDIAETNSILDAQRSAIEHDAQAWESLKETQQNAVNAGLTELSYYETLADELSTIVDENGKVKKGYEERASFISDQLSQALGKEIQVTDGIIENYQEMQDEIDALMDKKRAQIILDSQEALYKEAIENRTAALLELNAAEETLNTTKARLVEAEQEYRHAEESMETGRMAALKKEIEARQEAVNSAQKNYDDQEALLAEYAYNIGVYEQNMALAHEGNYDQMSTISWDYVKDYQNASDAQKKQLEDQIKAEETNLEKLRSWKQQNGTDIYNDQIDASTKRLAQLRDEMKQYESATESGLTEVRQDWKTSLGEQLSEITGQKVEFKNASNGLTQMYIEGVEVGKPQTKKAMQELVKDSISAVSEGNAQAKAAGENLIEGVNSGIKNEKKQSSVFNSIKNFGSKLLSKLKSSLQEHSPSKATKEMGQFLMQGLYNGVDDGKGKVFKQIGTVGQDVLSELNTELSQGVALGRITSPRVAGGGVSMVDAFKQALSEMKIVLDDEVAGQFVERTVTNVIYA